MARLSLGRGWPMIDHPALSHSVVVLPPLIAQDSSRLPFVREALP
jgi:hypothetical protein